jgi:hypothetical protein
MRPAAARPPQKATNLADEQSFTSTRQDTYCIVFALNTVNGSIFVMLERRTG